MVQVLLEGTYVPVVAEEAVLEHACAWETVVLEHTLALDVALVARTCALAVVLLAHTFGLLQGVLLEYTFVHDDEVALVPHACVLEAVVPKKRRAVQSDLVGSDLVHYDRSARGLAVLSLGEPRAGRPVGED